MAATIQTIQTPKRARALDTSGNNNHGQIYSGRALEFDGVTDYFQHNGGTALAGVNSFADNVDWTLAYWINFTTDSSLTYMVGNDGNTSPCFILHVDDNLSFRADDGDIYDFSSDKINYGTWYRMVLIAESNTVKLYLNGVQYGSTITTSTARTSGSAGSGTFPGSGFEMTGWGMPYGIPRNHGIDGHMSDGQVWDAAWTADDITFDYLNPEQLALNRGGTSLTESNLKLWYPMQDGHRGQQSFILDGSNTGLGDEMVAVNDLKGYTSIPTGWSTDNTDGTHTVTWDSRGARFYAEATGTIIYLKHTAQVVEGQTYKLEVVISNYGGDSGIKIDSARTSDPITFTSNGTHTKYVTAAASGQLVSFYRNGINVDLVIESVSLKPINAKNHQV